MADYWRLRAPDWFLVIPDTFGFFSCACARGWRDKMSHCQPAIGQTINCTGKHPSSDSSCTRRLLEQSRVCKHGQGRLLLFRSAGLDLVNMQTNKQTKEQTGEWTNGRTQSWAAVVRVIFHSNSGGRSKGENCALRVRGDMTFAWTLEIGG